MAAGENLMHFWAKYMTIQLNRHCFG